MIPWFSKSKEETLSELHATPTGLTQDEAAARLARDGKNALKEGKKRTLLQKFLDQMKDMMIVVLLVASLVSGILAIVMKEYSDLIDAGIILLIVVLNAIVGVVQENKAEASMQALKNLNKPHTTVLRAGETMVIKSEELVVGDIVHLEAGDIVPADLRLLEVASLKIEEAALTGESVPAEKGDVIIEDQAAALGDRVNMAYSTGIVRYGNGTGVVVATGMQTEVGKIATMLNEHESVQTPLQKQLAKTAKMLSIAVLIVAGVIFATALIRGFLSGGDMAHIAVDSFMTAVAIAVAAIPEGLPAVVTIVLAIGVQKMSEKNAIVKNLPSVEALGCCNVICSDKTGTLTINKMTVLALYTKDLGVYNADTKQTAHTAQLLVEASVLCNDTVKSEEGLLGDPTETALIAYADTLFDTTAFLASAPRLQENPFDSERKMMSTLNQTGEGMRAHIKGAPEFLLNNCTQIVDGTTIRPLTDDDRLAIEDANKELASRALRVLAVAVKYEGLAANELEQQTVFVGLVGMIDPPRPEAKEAVATCKRAGITTVMITGDHRDTAAAIAKEIGILSEGQEVLTGKELDLLSDETFAKEIGRYRVFARVSPENKVRIVKAFQTNGYKVAMTGDGVNDAPSIKAAEIGIGMGITGTEVSKDAADMVLADDNFSTIVGAVEEGRKVYANIKKAVQYLLSANIAEVLCLFVATVFLGVPFLTPVMILWVNLVTDSLPALALGTEKAERDIMDKPPRQADASLFQGKTGFNIIVQGLMQTLLVMGSFCIGRYALFVGQNEAIPMTMAFTTLCMIQLFHSYNSRSESRSLFATNPLGNKKLNLAFLVCVVLLAVVLFVPTVGPLLFDTAAASEVGAKGFGVAFGLALGIIPMVELQKFIEKKWVGKKQIKARKTHP